MPCSRSPEGGVCSWGDVCFRGVSAPGGWPSVMAFCHGLLLCPSVMAFWFGGLLIEGGHLVWSGGQKATTPEGHHTRRHHTRRHHTRRHHTRRPPHQKATTPEGHHTRRPPQKGGAWWGAPQDGYWRYASYWNAFLFDNVFLLKYFPFVCGD